MRSSLATGAARVCAAATLIFSLGLVPSYARMGGPGGGSFARPGLGAGHFAPHGFNRRFDGGRFGFHRFGPNRFDRFVFNRFNRFGFNRFDRFAGNQLFIGGLGCCGWGGWGGFPVSTGASEPVVVGGGAPVIINISADPKSGDAGAGSGGCITHKLIYDGDGKYVGEKQSSQC